jgi:RHS repeat-associated protein
MLTSFLSSKSSKTASANHGRGWFRNASASLTLALLMCATTASTRAQIGNSFTDSSPTIDTDVSSLIVTGCGYDAWTGSVRRHVVDFEVPGAIGQHGLKWERTYNSSTGQWSFAYTYQMLWRPFYQTENIVYPDGRQSHFEVGTKERLFNRPDPNNPNTSSGTSYGLSDVYLEDGSIVHFYHTTERIGEPDQQRPTYEILDTYAPLGMQDRYGHGLTFSWEAVDDYNSRLIGVTDESGRSITLVYNTPTNVAGYLFCPSLVYGSDGQWVKYTWQTLQYASNGATAATLIKAEHSDGTVDQYKYDPVIWGINSDHSAPGLTWARDTRASGPMQNIYYEYNNTGRFSGQIQAEHYLNPDNSMGVMVSSLNSTINSYSGGQDTAATQTEMRGDGPTCQIRMEKLNQGAGPPFTTWKSDYKGFQEKFTYNGNFFVNAVTDRNNNITHFQLESIIGNPLSRIHPDSTHIDYTYTDSFYPYYLASVKDENGNLTTYTRNLINAAVNPNMVTRIDYPDGAYETFDYDNFGHIIRHQRRKSGLPDDPQAFEYADYGPTGLLTTLWNPTTKNSRDQLVAGDPHTSYVYYSASEAWPDRIKTTTDPNGNVTQYTYDTPNSCVSASDSNGNALQCRGRGLTTQMSYLSDTHGGTIPGGTYKSFGYDAYANKIWEEDELLHPTSYAYDDYKRLVSTTDPLGHTSTTDYTLPGTSSPYVHSTDAWGTKKTPPTTSAPNGISTTQTFDNNLRVLTRTEAAQDPATAATTSFAYDNDGNRTSVTDPRNNSATTIYDSRNRKHQTIGPPPLNQTTTWDYDPASNVLTVTRADGTLEQNTYDAMNRLSSHTDGDSAHVTSFTYYLSGKMRTVTDANNHTTTFYYDASDLKTRMVYHNGDDQEFAYDNNHNLLSRRIVSGVYQLFTYDERNRKTLSGWFNVPDPNSYPHFWANSSDTVRFNYDAAGRLAYTYGNDTITHSYDNANRLIMDDQNIGSGLHYAVQYEYDAANERTRMYVSGASYDVSFGYDSMGRLQKVANTADPKVVWVEYSYDRGSNVTHRLNKLSNVDQDYGTFDAVNRMTQRELKINGNRMSVSDAYEAYGYDSMNRLTSLQREDNKSDSFGYNNSGEMTSAGYQASNRSVSYNLDLVGNRNSVVDTGVTKNYTADNINRYTTADSTTANSNNVGSGPEHQVGDFQNNHYDYEGDAFLAQISGGGNAYVVSYDPMGRPWQRGLTLGGQTTWSYYFYDGDRPILEFNVDGTIRAKNVYGRDVDEILMRTDYLINTSGQTYYYQCDHEGSITHLTDGAGVVLETYRYDAFGAVTMRDGGGGLISASNHDNRFMFTGREYLSQFGIYEYRARAYHPGIGRFVSEDPKGFDAGDYNLFRYCHNDPEDLTDPMGLEIITVSDEVDMVSRGGLDLLHFEARMARHGQEIATSTYMENGMAWISEERCLGQGLPRGLQHVVIPYPKPGSGIDPETAVHVHRNDIEVGPDGKTPAKLGTLGTLTTGADRYWADTQHKAIYTENARGTIQERYLPDDKSLNAGVYQRWDPKTQRYKDYKTAPNYVKPQETERPKQGQLIKWEVIIVHQPV